MLSWYSWTRRRLLRPCNHPVSRDPTFFFTWRRILSSRFTHPLPSHNIPPAILLRRQFFTVYVLYLCILSIAKPPTPSRQEGKNPQTCCATVVVASMPPPNNIQSEGVNKDSTEKEKVFNFSFTIVIYLNNWFSLARAREKESHSRDSAFFRTSKRPRTPPGRWRWWWC